jgi:hypothetical protein
VDDFALERGVELCERLSRVVPTALFTIENPVNDVFPFLPGIRRLLGQRGWRMLTTSYCKCAGPNDPGDWPQKDTNVLVRGVPRDFEVPLCDWDCNYLLPSCNRHRRALCRSRHNHPDQVVIEDQFDKGRIPMGLFERTFKAHSDWKERWYPGEVVKQAALALEHRHMPTAVDAVRVLRAAGGVSVCAGLPAVCDKFGLTTDHDASQFNQE